MKYTINDINRLVIDMPNGESHFGTNQEWFTSVWQRMAGCGPSTASNLLLYHGKSGRFEMPTVVKDQAGLIHLMEFAWKHITPGMRGVNKTSMFYEGIDEMLESIDSDLRHVSLDIKRDKDQRPPLESVALFIQAGLSSDSPVAFLNLDSGEVADLDDWHWMTAYALEYDDASDTYTLSISDNGTLQKIDLGLWLETTKLGGGFVYIA